MSLSRGIRDYFKVVKRERFKKKDSFHFAMDTLEDALSLKDAGAIPDSEFLAIETSKRDEVIQTARKLIKDSFGAGSLVSLEVLKEKTGVVPVHLEHFSFLDGRLCAAYLARGDGTAVTSPVSEIIFYKTPPYFHGVEGLGSALIMGYNNSLRKEALRELRRGNRAPFELKDDINSFSLGRESEGGVEECKFQDRSHFSFKEEFYQTSFGMMVEGGFFKCLATLDIRTTKIKKLMFTYTLELGDEQSEELRIQVNEGEQLMTCLPSAVFHYVPGAKISKVKTTINDIRGEDTRLYAEFDKDGNATKYCMSGDNLSGVNKALMDNLMGQRIDYVGTMMAVYDGVCRDRVKGKVDELANFKCLQFVPK